MALTGSQRRRRYGISQRALPGRPLGRPRIIIARSCLPSSNGRTPVGPRRAQTAKANVAAAVDELCKGRQSPKCADGSLRCSFCGKASSKACTLIAEPGVYISTYCVGLCDELLDEEKAHSPLVGRWSQCWQQAPARRLAEIDDQHTAVDVEDETAYILNEDVDAPMAARPTQAVRFLPGHDQWVMGRAPRTSMSCPRPIVGW